MIGTVTFAGQAGANPSAPVFIDHVSFALDNSYPTGGYAFLAKFQAATKDGRKPLAIIAQDAGGYLVSYDPALDKLKVWRNGAINTPHAEVPDTTDLSLVTVKALVISQ